MRASCFVSFSFNLSTRVYPFTQATTPKDREHVRRQFTKKLPLLLDTKYTSTVEEQRVLYIACRSREQAGTYGLLLLKIWEAHGEKAFASAMKKYVHPDGEHNQWYHTASGLFGLTPITQAEERKHREDHRYVQANAKHKTVLEKSLPALLTLDAALRVGINRRLPLPLPPVVYTEALRWFDNLVMDEWPQNFLRYKNDTDFVFYYVNTDPESKLPVTEIRAKKYRASLVCQNKGSFRTVKGFEKDCLTLHEVAVSRDRAVASNPNEGDSCDCQIFWEWLVCPHLLGCLDIEGHVNLREAMMKSHPANGKRVRQCDK